MRASGKTDDDPADRQQGHCRSNKEALGHGVGASLFRPPAHREERFWSPSPLCQLC